MPSTHLPCKLLKQAPELAVFLMHLTGVQLKGRAIAELRWDSLRRMKDEDLKFIRSSFITSVAYLSCVRHRLDGGTWQ